MCPWPAAIRVHGPCRKPPYQYDDGVGSSLRCSNWVIPYLGACATRLTLSRDLAFLRTLFRGRGSPIRVRRTSAPRVSSDQRILLAGLGQSGIVDPGSPPGVRFAVPGPRRSTRRTTPTLREPTSLRVRGRSRTGSLVAASSLLPERGTSDDPTQVARYRGGSCQPSDISSFASAGRPQATGASSRIWPFSKHCQP